MSELNNPRAKIYLHQDDANEQVCVSKYSVHDERWEDNHVALSETPQSKLVSASVTIHVMSNILSSAGIEVIVE